MGVRRYRVRSQYMAEVEARLCCEYYSGEGLKPEIEDMDTQKVFSEKEFNEVTRSWLTRNAHVGRA